MVNKAKTLRFLFLLIFGCKGMNLETKSTLNSNSIESFILEYQQMNECQQGKFKPSFDETFDQKLDEYIVIVEEMRSKLHEIRKYSHLQLVENLNEKLAFLNMNLSTITKEKTNLNKLIEKCQSDLESTEFSLTRMTKDKNNFQIELEALKKNFNEIMDEKNNIIVKQNKILIISNIVAFIKKGGFTLGHEFFSISNIYDRDLLIASIYDKNINNAEIVIDFLNSLLDDDEVIQGYRLLFDQMIKNQHVFSTPTTTIAYRVFVDFNQRFGNNKNLIHLRENLPQSLKNFPWNTPVVIENLKFNKSIAIYDDGGYRHDNLRLITFIYSTGVSNGDLAVHLIPISKGKDFYFKGKIREEYLYAEINEFNVDSNRRAVFSWRNKNQSKEPEGRWRLEPIEGSPYFKIKNVHWNEYLSVADEVTRHNHPKLFTLISGKCEDDFCKWNFLKYTGQ